MRLGAAINLRRRTRRGRDSLAASSVRGAGNVLSRGGGAARESVPLSLLLFITSDGVETRKTEHLPA